MSERPIMPLATVQDLDEEIAATERSLDRLGALHVVDQERRDELIARLETWLRRMKSQRAAMLEQVVA